MSGTARRLAALVIIASCALPVAAKDPARRIDAGRGHVYAVAESHPVGASLSDLRVRLETQGSLPREVSLRDRSPLADTFAGDLDGNGEPELYLVTRSAGSGSYGGIIAVLPGAGGALVTVEPPAVTEADLAAGQPFEGYAGHDRWSAAGHRLWREFPVYRAGDINTAPGGGTRRIGYSLDFADGQPVLRMRSAEKSP